MSLLCSTPIWIDGHVSDCVVNNFLGKVVPFVTCFASIAIYNFRHLYPFISQTVFRNQKILKGRIPYSDTELFTTISPTISQLEVAVIVADIIISVSLLVGIKDTADHLPIFVSALSSTYFLFLALVRKTLQDSSTSHELQRHSVVLYTIQLGCLAIINHALAIQNPGLFVMTANLLRFVVFTVLCLCHWTAPRTKPRTINGDDGSSSDTSKQDTAAIISRLTFSWLNGLVWKSFRATLEISDLYQLSHNHKSGIIIPRFQVTMPVTLPLLRRLYWVVKYDMLRQGGWAALNSLFVLLPPVLIRAILQHLEYPETILKSTAWLCAGGILVAGVVSSIAGSQCDWTGNRMTAKLRAILINEIYEKSLRKRMTPNSSPDEEPSPKAETYATDGNILNLMSVDVEHVSATSGSLYLIWVIFPVQTTLGTWLLYKILGISGVLGVLCMICLLPLNFLISQRVMRVQTKLLKASDSRIQTGNEVLNNIHTVKYSAWESHFGERVMQKRKLEIYELRSRFIWWSINATTFHSLPLIVTIITCFLYTVVWGNPLKTSVAFPALAIFGIIRIPLDRMAASITFLLQAHVSLARIDQFLQERETGKLYHASKSDQFGSIGFDDATLSWPTRIPLSASETNGISGGRDSDIPLDEVSSSSNRPFRLENLNIYFKPESLNIVCGPSGSGKSSLLLALLGEMDLINGQVILPEASYDNMGNPSIGLTEAKAYCPQEPWIMNESIRSNIIFNTPFDSQRYAAVLDAVALYPDIASLDQGDQTLCGENGARLSGGQKQRVALGRMLYSRCRYALLDDCLSAVDPHTASHIFFCAVRGPLMKGRTCVMATHNTRLTLPYSDYVVMLDNGHIVGQGPPEELVRSGLLDADMVEKRPESPLSTPTITNMSTSTLPDYARKASLDADSLDGISLSTSDEKETYKEKKAEGAVSSYVLRSYLTAMGNKLFLVIVLGLFALQQIASLGTTLWIKEWALQSDLVQDHAGEELAGTTGESANADETVKIKPWFYITVYTGLCGLYALITIIRDLITFHGSLKASSSIFEKLLDSVLHAKLQFFDSVPLGQITNRFSKDVEAMDQVIPGFAISALQLVATITMVVVFISVVLPAFLIVAAFICVAYYFVLAIYINGARDLKRIEAVQRSPLFQQFGETLSGYISIRAYHQTSIFTAQHRKLIDRLNQPYLLQCAGKEWLTFRVTLLGSLISFSTAAFVLWSPKSIDFGNAGLVLTYSTTFTENIMWFVQVYAFIQQNLNSVDRILEYSNVEQEHYKPRSTAIYDMPTDWPSQGGIRFVDYTTRYASDLNTALSKVNFEAKPGQRIGIVGRTGAGKSTLTLALLRCLEAESGRIEIDGVDISTLPLDKLRQAIAIVPQNPELFDGTIRDNLDPLQRYTDDEVISVLHQVHLFDQINATITGPVVSCLDHAADVLSLGQRQLLCIARALLRRSRILVLDEATASIDHATDAAIQTSLEANVLNNTTVLTVAHRLRTIAAYDHIVVLDSGRVVEQGSVQTLLAQDSKSSVFHQMCEESGDLEVVEHSAF
ncbi:ATP-dependent bile acid permease [Talaromyces pinophilus]|nr:ATP-dependent bile acid permease [Talaromyces pinophilus]